MPTSLADRIRMNITANPARAFARELCAAQLLHMHNSAIRRRLNLRRVIPF